MRQNEKKTKCISLWPPNDCVLYTWENACAPFSPPSKFSLSSVGVGVGVWVCVCVGVRLCDCGFNSLVVVIASQITPLPVLRTLQYMYKDNGK